jgi:hypothetical protein
MCMYVCKPYVHTVRPLLLSFHPSAPPSVFVPTVRSSVRPSILPSFHLSTHPQIHLPLRPPSYLLIQLPIYLFPGNLISSFRGIQCIIASGGLYSVIRWTWTAVGFIHFLIIAGFSSTPSVSLQFHCALRVLDIPTDLLKKYIYVDSNLFEETLTQ